METNLEKAKRLLIDKSAIQGIELKGDEYLFELLKLAAKPDIKEINKQRSDKITLLEAYSLFLEKDGYMDIDWRAEEPYAIDEFLKPNKP